MEIELILYGFGVILQGWYSESGTDGILLEEYLKLECIPVKLYLHIFSLYDGKRNRWKREQIMDRQEVFGLVRKKIWNGTGLPVG